MSSMFFYVVTNGRICFFFFLRLTFYIKRCIGGQEAKLMMLRRYVNDRREDKSAPIFINEIQNRVSQLNIIFCTVGVLMRRIEFFFGRIVSHSVGVPM